jgi:ribosomal subunit interface protein
MQIDIQARSFPLTEALKKYAEQKLISALHRCQDHLNRVVIRLSDINGPRGGEDKHCHVHVVLPGIPDVIIEDTEEDMYAAIDKAIDRAESAVVRKVERQQSVLRHSRPLRNYLSA